MVFPLYIAGVCACIHRHTKGFSAFLIRHYNFSVKKKVKKARLLLVTNRAPRRIMPHLNISTFMHYCTFCVLSLNMKSFQLLFLHAYRRSPESCHLRALTINTSVLTLYAAAADNKASWRAGLKDK